MNPRAVTQAEADLIQHLADTIVQKEVIEPMERVGWTEHTSPELVESSFGLPEDMTPTPEQESVKTPENADNPQTLKAPTAAQPATPSDSIDWESLRGTNGLILDKYKNPSEAVKGVRHAVAMAKDALGRVGEKDKEIQTLRTQMQTMHSSIAVQPTAEPTRQSLPSYDTTELDKVLEEIVEEGGTFDEAGMKKYREALGKFTQGVAKATVEEALSAREAQNNAEKQTWTKVDNYMRSTYPESINFTDELNLFVQTNPEVGDIVSDLIRSNRHTQAAIYAWKEFSRERDVEATTVQHTADVNKEIALQAADDVRREAVDRARVDAGVMTTVASGVHESIGVGPSQSEIDDAAAEMNATGLGQRWRSLTIGKDLKGPWFD